MAIVLTSPLRPDLIMEVRSGIHEDRAMWLVQDAASTLQEVLPLRAADGTPLAITKLFLKPTFLK